MRRLLAGSVKAAACGVVLAASVLIPSTTAEATIDSCFGYYSAGERWDAYCYGRYPSQFRAKATCYSYNTGVGRIRYGATKYAGGGSNSVVVCQTGEYIADGTWQTFP